MTKAEATTQVEPEKKSSRGDFYFQMRDLPGWWPRFKQFCKDRRITIRVLILWLLARFIEDAKMQEEFGRYLMKGVKDIKPEGY